MRWLCFCFTLLFGCGDDADSSSSIDGSMSDADSSTPDSSQPIDGAMDDASMRDGGSSAQDATTETDSGPPRGLECEALDPAGTIVEVTESQASDLPVIVRNASSGTTIVLGSGTYPLGGERLRFHVPGVTLMGQSGDASAVIIDGAYETDEILYITASNTTIAHLTIRRAENHLIHATAEGDATENTTGLRLYDLRLFDSGEQFVKVNSNGGDTAFVDNSIVECSYFELTDAGRPNIERSPGGCYTGGIDTHEGRGWVVRNNEFRNIYCAGEGLAEHAIHFWRGARDTLVENNIIIDCARGIGFGLGNDGAGRTYADDPYPGITPIGHFGGVIRNNVVFAEIDFYDTGIELQQAHGVRVHHNTVVSTNETGFFSSIDYRFANTQAEIRNNLTRRITQRNEGSAALEANLENTPMGYFEAPSSGDFHLTSMASDAIDQGVVLDDAGLDLDGDEHANGIPDLGADEY